MKPRCMSGVWNQIKYFQIIGGITKVYTFASVVRMVHSQIRISGIYLPNSHLIIFLETYKLADGAYSLDFRLTIKLGMPRLVRVKMRMHCQRSK